MLLLSNTKSTFITDRTLKVSKLLLLVIVVVIVLLLLLHQIPSQDESLQCIVPRSKKAIQPSSLLYSL